MDRFCSNFWIEACAEYPVILKAVFCVLISFATSYMPLSHFGEFDGDSTANQFAAQSQRIRSAVSAQTPWSRSAWRILCECVAN